MRIAYFVAIAMLATGPLMGEDKPNDTAIEKLQGRWEIVGGVNQGQKLPPAAVTGTFLTVETNTITTYDASEQQKFRAVFQIDGEKKPIQITMTNVPDEALPKPPTTIKGKQTTETAVVGILKFEGPDKWTLCYSLPGGDLPKKFESPKGSKRMLFKMERKHDGEALLDATTLRDSK